MSNWLIEEARKLWADAGKEWEFYDAPLAFRVFADFLEENFDDLLKLAEKGAAQ